MTPEGPEDWPWSSVAAHPGGSDGCLTAAAAPGGEVGHWRAFLAGGLKRGAQDPRRHEHIGRPPARADFLTELEQRLGRRLHPGKRGRKKGGTAGAELH